MTAIRPVCAKFWTRVRRRAAGYTVSALLLQTPAAAAENSTSLATSPNNGCTQEHSTALSEIGCELALQIQLTQPTLVVSQAPSADAKAVAVTRLASRIAQVVAAAMGNFGRPHIDPANASAARMAAAKHGALLHLEPRIQNGKLQVSADLYPIARGFWDRVRKPPPSAVGHGFAERRLDPELRSFFAPIPLVASRTIHAAPPERGPVALACGDADLDGSLEVAFVGRQRVALGRFRGGRFQSLASKSWTELSPVAATPVRAPLAAARFLHSGGLDVGSSDRRDFVRLDPHLKPMRSAPRRIPFGSSCLSIDGHQLAAVAIPCLPKDAESHRHSGALAAGTPSIRAAFLNAEGKEITYSASHLANEDTIIIQRGATELGRLADAGGQFAFADLNGDGVPELLSSRATLEPAEDELAVHTIEQSGQLKPQFSVAVPDGITALAACPPTSNSMGSIIVGTQARLWVIQ